MRKLILPIVASLCALAAWPAQAYVGPNGDGITHGNGIEPNGMDLPNGTNPNGGANNGIKHNAAARSSTASFALAQVQVVLPRRDGQQ